MGFVHLFFWIPDFCIHWKLGTSVHGGPGSLSCPNGLWCPLPQPKFWGTHDSTCKILIYWFLPSGFNPLALCLVFLSSVSPIWLGELVFEGPMEPSSFTPVQHLPAHTSNRTMPAHSTSLVKVSWHDLVAPKIFKQYFSCLRESVSWNDCSKINHQL